MKGCMLCSGGEASTEFYKSARLEGRLFVRSLVAPFGLVIVLGEIAACRVEAEAGSLPRERARSIYEYLNTWMGACHSADISVIIIHHLLTYFMSDFLYLGTAASRSEI